MNESNFVRIAREIGELVDKKNKAYGDATVKSTKILEVLYPNGIPVKGLYAALLVTRIVDKLCRIAEDNDEFNESPFTDIAGYGILGTNQAQQKCTCQKDCDCEAPDIGFKSMTCPIHNEFPAANFHCPIHSR